MFAGGGLMCRLQAGEAETVAAVAPNIQPLAAVQNVADGDAVMLCSGGCATLRGVCCVLRCGGCGESDRATAAGSRAPAHL